VSSIERVDMEIGYLLHARPYRETSQILEVLSHHHGRVGLVARGARRPKSRWGPVLRPFQPLYLSWSGRGSLYTLRAVEPSGPPVEATGLRLMSGYYLNELLMTLTHRGDPHPELFAHYGAALSGLVAKQDAETALRQFEVALLAETGYGLVLNRDTSNDEPLQAEKLYEYVIDRGPVAVPVQSSGDLIFTGEELMSISSGKFANRQALRSGKRLLRAVLHHQLGGRPLKTRAVLAAMK
jgi:DNA repair protein RecO (recombination protein O)